MVMGCGYFGNVNSATEGLRGRISCFRLTRRALTTDEFLYAASTPVAEADTLFRLPFDGEAGSPFTRTFAAPLLYRYATATHNASANPDYSASVDLNRPFLFSGGTKLGENTSCAEFWGKSDLYTSDWAGSRVAVAADEGLHPESFTLELFAAMRQHQTHAGRGRLLMAKGNGTANTYTWRVTVLQDDRLQLDYYEGDTLRTATTDQAAFTGLAQWKHIAVTYDAAGMELRLLVNYKPVITRTLEQALKTNTAYGYTFGGGIDSYGFNGWMDEIRLSKTALGIEDMLRLKPHEGTLMLIH